MSVASCCHPELQLLTPGPGSGGPQSLGIAETPLPLARPGEPSEPAGVPWGAGGWGGREGTGVRPLGAGGEETVGPHGLKERGCSPSTLPEPAQEELCGETSPAEALLTVAVSAGMRLSQQCPAPPFVGKPDCPVASVSAF